MLTAAEKCSPHVWSDDMSFAKVGDVSDWCVKCGALKRAVDPATRAKWMGTTKESGNVQHP